ncbi:DUF1552 domain-containing protein [Nannocystaceae bacterium ST9]
MTTHTRLTRRRLLLGTAGTALTIPLLPSLLPRSARAAPGDPPPRLVVMYTGNGQLVDSWLPTGSENDFQLSTVLAPLAPFQAKLNVVHGMVGNPGHFMGHSECLTGRPLDGANHMPAGGPSVDQLIAGGLTNQVALESLQLGVDTDNDAASIISYTETGLALPPQASARGAFERIAGIVDVDPLAAERRRAQARSVLDSVIADYQSIQPRLSSDERILLDAHLELVREQEMRLQMPFMPIECGQLPDSVGDLDVPTTFLGHIDTLTAALACDVTRVVTLVMGGAEYTGHYEWAGVNEDYHECAHGSVANASALFTQANVWHAEMFAALLARLDSIPEGNGTLLDNTVVLWTNELGLHQHSHDKSDMGVVLAGSAAGFFSTGRFVNLAGAHYHDLLLTLAHAMGRTDLTSFGDSGTTLLDALLA